MKPTPELIAEAQRVVPDLDEVRERLDSEPDPGPRVQDIPID